MKTWEFGIVGCLMLILQITLVALVIWGAWFGIRAVIDYAKRPAPVVEKAR